MVQQRSSTAFSRPGSHPPTAPSPRHPVRPISIPLDRSMRGTAVPRQARGFLPRGFSDACRPSTPPRSSAAGIQDLTIADARGVPTKSSGLTKPDLGGGEHNAGTATFENVRRQGIQAVATMFSSGSPRTNRSMLRATSRGSAFDAGSTKTNRRPQSAYARRYLQSLYWALRCTARRCANTIGPV